jgi:hypothetical protein
VIGSHERTRAFVYMAMPSNQPIGGGSAGPRAAIRPSPALSWTTRLAKGGASKRGTRRKEPNVCGKKIDATGWSGSATWLREWGYGRRLHAAIGLREPRAHGPRAALRQLSA